MIKQYNIPYQVFTLITLVCLSCSGSIQAKHSVQPELTGVWVLDVEESKRIQPARKKSSLFSRIKGSTNVSIGGIPLPKSSTSNVPDSRGKANDPDVLFCTGMTIVDDPEFVRIDYDGLGAKTFYLGKVRGRKTTYNGKSMSTSYKSISRKVSQKYQLQGPDKVIVTITIKPGSGPKNIVKKVFYRSTGK